MHINDFPRPTSTLTRPLCILMIVLDLPRHLLDSNPANSQHAILLLALNKASSARAICMRPFPLHV